MIKGSIVALVTPMFPDGGIDFGRLRALVDFHVLNGTDGLVVAATTGESSALTHDEHLDVSRSVVDHASGRIPVMVGCGANSTAHAIDLTRCAKNLGADAVLSVVPYFNKPTQEGMYRHFRSVAEAVDIPVVLYNAPHRTGCDLANDTVRRLMQVPNIVGIKDATGDVARGTDLLLSRPEGFSVYSGDDATGLALLLLGSDGVVSVTANVAPRAMHDMCAAALHDDSAAARRINNALFKLHRGLFLETNPIPVKWLAAQMGLVEDGIRLPLTPLSPAYHDVLRSALAAAGSVGI